MEVKTTSVPVGHILVIFVAGDYLCSTTEMLTFIGYYAAVFAVGAATLGWILQCLIMITVGTSLGREVGKGERGPNKPILSPGSPAQAERHRWTQQEEGG